MKRNRIQKQIVIGTVSETNADELNSSQGSMGELLEESKSVHSETSPLPKSMIIDND